MEISKRLLVPYSAERMFDLIEAAEHYPAFMPWCASATIVERSDEVVVADIVVAHKGVRFDLRTRNPKRRPQAMSIRLERGPFRRFEGEWRLWPLGGDGCRIEFEMRYDFNTVMARLAGPVFDRITSAMVDAYVARADALYGGQRDATVPVAAAPPAAAMPMASDTEVDTPGKGPAPTNTTAAAGPTPAPTPAAESTVQPTNPDPPRSEKP
jgi:ribosome-associated toxin RatA of RatAB toxin-antitoxin module